MDDARRPTRPRTIAVDGPAAAGKSTVGRRLAEALGYLFFDTGALYRALAVMALAEGLPLDDGPALAALAERRPIDVVPSTGSAAGFAVLAAGEDLTGRLWTPEADAASSVASRHAEVRRALLVTQRRVATGRPTVMVGRDIGTVVLPDADLKLYLDASPEARARRRYREQLARGEAARFGDVLGAIRARDERDASRAAAPLAVARQAVVVNTDACGVEAVVAHVLALVDRWPDRLTTEGGAAPCGTANARG